MKFKPGDAVRTMATVSAGVTIHESFEASVVRIAARTDGAGGYWYYVTPASTPGVGPFRFTARELSPTKKR
jgi:hypothetical protein